MARKFPAGLSTGRSDVFNLDPLSESLIVDEKRFNVARWEPTTPAQVRDLAEKIVKKPEEHGPKNHRQLLPIMVRRPPTAAYSVAAGFTRTTAIRLINQDADFRKRLGLKDGEVYPLRAEITNQAEDDALLDNIDENLHRIDASAMDKANVVAVLAARGWSDKQVADRFNWTANWIGQLKKLQNLDKAHQKLVHQGVLGVQAAIDLTDINPDERDEVLDSAIKESRGNGGKANGQTIRAAKRDKAIEQAEKNGTTPAQTVGRSMKDLRRFFEEQASADAGGYDVARKFFKKMLDYTHGKCSERTVLNAVNEMIETEYEITVEDAA